VNDLTNAATLAHLLKYDSVSATCTRSRGQATASRRRRRVQGAVVQGPAQLPWKDLGVDVVFEVDRLFTNRDARAKHLAAGAKKVIITAPAKKPGHHVVLGVNEDKYDAASTTSSRTPRARPTAWRRSPRSARDVRHQEGLDDDHPLLHERPAAARSAAQGLRRARGRALSMIPTTTGARRAVGEVLPELKGKLDGFAMRVPTPNVSVVDLAAILDKKTTAEE
jgi:glyceraldehyde 3-phosphate dehydrogenase